MHPIIKAAQDQLVAWHDQSLVKGSWELRQLPSEVQIVELLRDTPLANVYKVDDKFQNMLRDLRTKEREGDTDYSFRMTIKHLTTRAVEIIGEYLGRDPVSVPQVNLMTTMVDEAIESLTGFEEVVKVILANPDRRSVPSDIRKAFDGESLQVRLNVLAKHAKDAQETLARFSDVLYVLDLEESNGKGEWREIATAEKHLRISINAVTSLRRTHPISVGEARNVVEAYMAGMFA